MKITMTVDIVHGETDQEKAQRDATLAQTRLGVPEERQTAAKCEVTAILRAEGHDPLALNFNRWEDLPPGLAVGMTATLTIGE